MTNTVIRAVLQTQQNAVASALAEEKDGRVTQLEYKLSLLADQLQDAMAKLAALNAGADDKISALRSEESVMDDRFPCSRTVEGAENNWI